VWAIASCLVCSSLLARHLLPLPAESSPALSQGLARLRSPEDEGRFVAFHVLFADCECSRRVADRLATTQRPPAVSERVLLVGEAPEVRSSLERRGFLVTMVAPEELTTRFGIESAPILVVAAPDGSVRYAGGYTERKQALVPHDREIIEAAVAGRAPPPLPVYGCPVAERLKRERNPLGIP